MINKFLLYLKYMDEYIKNPNDESKRKLILIKEILIPINSPKTNKNDEY